MKTLQKETFIKKYWFYIIFIIIGLVLAGIGIDVYLSHGGIVTKEIKIFNDIGKTSIVNDYVFQYDYPFAKALSTFLYSLAMSLMIALFILKVIQKDDDEQRKLDDEERKNELFKNVFKGVFDRLVPNEIFDVIKKDILEANIVRKKVKWIFDFSIEEDKIVLCRNVMYEAHNLTSEDCIEPFSYIFSSTEYTSTKIEFLKWHNADDIGTTQVAYDSEDTGQECETGKKAKKQKLKKGLCSSNIEHKKHDGTIEQVKKDINIPVNKIVFINFKSKEEYKSSINYLHETHFSSACSIGWELQVNYPKGYDFSIIPVFSSGIQTVVDENTRKEYKYNGAILKGQGIEFTLTKLNEN